MGSRREWSIKSGLLAVATVIVSICPPSSSTLAQTAVCVLSPDKHSPNDRILRCGGTLTLRPAPGSLYHPLDGGSDGVPESVQLDSGALLIEFHPTEKRHDFQILTPQAIASVRGTQWAVEVKPGRSAVFVLSGVVEVARANRAAAVVLRRGQGVDVTAADGPLQVKRWAPARINALLARFSP
jgi:hypothetical protein